MTEPLNLLGDLIARARRAGADAADALLFDSVSLGVTVRLGATERLERSESGDLGLRVFVGKRMAMIASSDRSPAALDALVERAIAMARAVPEDPHCGLADPAELASGPLPSLDLVDPVEPAAGQLLAQAGAAEAAALAVKGVTNSEGAEAGWSRGSVAMVASNGFAGTYASTDHGISASAIAGTGTGMEVDSDSTSAVHAADLRDPVEVGRTAGERAVARLNPRKVDSAEVPVVYDWRVANGLVRHLAGGINGTSIARGTSFLKDKMGAQLFAPGITIVDDPHIPRGLRSKPFDGEGIANRRRNIIEDGRLTTWLLDLRSARQLGLATTGHAARGTGGPPGPSATNLWLEPGAVSPEELMADIDEGLYVTDMIGMGLNMVTGDYSRGASGFWIEKGRLTYAVSEITIAANLIDMFRNLRPANDFQRRYGVDAPTIRIDGMTVAGK